MHYVGIDLHRDFFVAVAQDATGTELFNKRYDNSVASVEELVSQFEIPPMVVVEATRNWMWFIASLQEKGCAVQLAHPFRTKAIASARIKTDKIDADTLAHLLRADLTSSNLQLINDFGWVFIAGLKSNRRMHIQEGKNHFLKKLSELDIPDTGACYHMKGYGRIKVFRITKDGNVDYYGTNNFTLSQSDIQVVFARRWEIEEYHRGVKQTVGIAAWQARTKRSQRTHIFCSILSFIALEKKRLEEDITWYESKRRIISDALFLYLKKPMIPLPTKS